MTNLHRAIEAWNRGLLDDYLALYDDSVRLYGYSPEPMDKAAVRDFYAMMFSAFPGSRWTVLEEVIDGDRATVRFVLTGAHKGNFMGIPPTGKGRPCSTSDVAE
jgi:predicted ester cyclase